MACINPNSPEFKSALQRTGNPLLAEIEVDKSQLQIKPGVTELFNSKRSFADYSDFGKTLSEQEIINLKKEGNKVTAKQFLESIIPVNDFEKKLKSFLLSIDLNKLNGFDFVINDKYQGNIIGLNERDLFEKPTVIFNSKSTTQPSRYKLHEFLHSLLDTVINEEQEFRTELISLFDYVKTLPEFKNEYGVIGWWEFYTEGMTNPNFQTKLKNVTLSGYKGGKKSSVYEEFVKIINGILEKLGFVNKDYSALDEIINATTKVIEKRYGYSVKPGVQELFDSNPELADSIYEAAGLRTLENNKLEQDIKELIKGREDIPSSIFLSYLVDNNLIPKIQEYITSIGYRHGEWNELYKRLTLDYSPINTKSEKTKLISHELMHALSHKYITSYEALRQPDFKEYILKTNENEKIKGTNRTIELVNLTKEQLDAFDNLVRIKEKVFDFIKSGKFNKNEKLTNANFGSLNYAFSELDKKEDIHEFISEVFSNPILIDVLKQIPTEGKKSNLFKEFIRALKIILGFNNESIIEDIFYYSEKAFINEALKESNTKKQQAILLYSQYLDTIFPDSKVKDIVYRVDKRTDLTPQTTVDDFTQVYVNGVYYTTELDYANNYNKVLNGKIYPTLLNIINPAEIKTKQDIERLGRNKIEFEKINKLKYSTNPKDSLIFDNNIYKTEDKYGEVGKEIVVFEPEQIHILGNKQDIENFAKFVKNSKSGNVRDMENYMNSKSLDYIIDKLIQSGKIEKRC